MNDIKLILNKRYIYKKNTEYLHNLVRIYTFVCKLFTNCGMQLLRNGRIVLLLCSLFMHFIGNAQLQHSLYVLCGGDIGLLIDNEELASPKGGGGGNFGFGYELQRKKFIFNVGLEAEFNRMRSHVNDFMREYDAVDTEGDAFIWRHNFYNRIDEADLVNLNIPLLFGGKFNNLYFLLGPKLSANILGRSREESKSDATAKYDGLLGEFSDMKNHSLYSGRILQDPWRSYSTNINLRVAGEFGIILNTLIADEPGTDILSTHGVELNFGVYIEAGVLNLIASKFKGGLVDYENVDEWPGVRFTQNYVYSSFEANKAYVIDMQFGIKIRCLFRLPQSKICVICSDNYNL